MIATETQPSAVAKPAAVPVALKDFKGKVNPDWCPGCGDFGVLVSIQKALVELQIAPHEVTIVSGIGCSSNLPGFIETYGMHTLHGRSLPVAAGLQLANHKLKVIATGGDGDGFGIGGNHFMHNMRRNVDLTYIVMDNQIYGLTTGQTSPTTRKGSKTKSTPFGNLENPINPIPLAIIAGATYVARGYSGNQKHLVDLIKAGIQHRGFSFIDVFSPCVTYNKENTHEFFKQRTKMLDEMGHKPTDKARAIELGFLWGDEIPIGLFYQNDDLMSLDEQEPVLTENETPLALRPLGISPEIAQTLIEEYM